MSYILKNEISNIKVISTDQDKQTVNGTPTYLNGSEIFYTPHPNANNVIYEFNFGYAWNPDAPNLCEIEIQQESGGTYSNLANSYRKLAFNTWNGYESSSVHLFYVLDPWQGRKGTRLTIASFDERYDFYIHRTKWYHNSSPIEKKIFPSIKIYSVIGDN